MRGSDFGPSGPPPSEGRTNRGDSRLKRIVLLVGVLGAFVMLAVGAIFAGAASAATQISHVCANKSSGQLFYLDSCAKSQIKVPLTSTDPQFDPQFDACYQESNGVTRKVPGSTKCSNKSTKKEIAIKVPDDEDPLYFCVGKDGTMYFKGTEEPTCAAPQYAVVIGPLNQLPVANDASAITNEDATVTITLSGSDADGDSLTFAIVENSGPNNGTLGPIIPTGPTTATVNYTPDQNFNGSDSFKYRANDGTVNSAEKTVSITVIPVNDEPSFTEGGAVTVNEDSGAYSAAWATAISAGPGESGQTVTFVVTNNNNDLFSSQPAISPSGTLSFTPAANAFGIATVTVFLTDNGGIANGGDDTSPTQTFTITVNAANP
jgi:Bacterial Ig domain